MDKYGIIGFPVRHSRSPQMQEAAFHALGMDASYTLLETPPEDLAKCVQNLRRQNFRGWNVTVPHKEAILPMLDEIHSEAAAAQSVNTVLNRNGRLHGFTTDGFGLERATMEAFGFSFRNTSILFLGTGGAARATAVYAAIHGASSITLVNRTLERAYRLADTISRAAPNVPLDCIRLSDTNAVASAAKSCKVLYQCTSLGLRPEDPPPFPAELLPPGMAVMDMIYGKTPFRQKAASIGCPTADGIGMLLHQGCKAFEIWTGRTAPIDIMRQALLSPKQ